VHRHLDPCLLGNRQDGLQEALQVPPHIVARDRLLLMRHRLGTDIRESEAAGPGSSTCLGLEVGPDHHRVLADLRHEVVRNDADPEIAQDLDDALVALGLRPPAFLGQDDPVDRRP
jgi:hypothetical protein